MPPSDTAPALGLKIDVDTFNGARRGVPKLLEILGRHRVRGSFFLSIGVDNMGRHAFRLLKPAFLLKMLRGGAAKLYGWDILFKGLLWPGPDIGSHLADIYRQISLEGHETALHALDHHAWQTRIARATPEWAQAQVDAAFTRWIALFGSPPRAAGSPAWQLSPAWLDAMAARRPLYLSDCRGLSPGRPVIDGKTWDVLEIPTTLPTFDESVGRMGVTPDNYNDWLLSMIRPGRLNVLTIHAEAEGGVYSGLFDDFLAKCDARGIRIVRLDDLRCSLPDTRDTPALDLRMAPVPGRDGPVATLGAFDPATDWMAMARP